MQKWEFLEINISYRGLIVRNNEYVYAQGGGDPTQPEAIKVNGRWLQPKVDKPNNSRAYFPKLIDYLTKLGQEGWELIAISPSPEVTVNTLDAYCYLKRPLLEENPTK